MSSLLHGNGLTRTLRGIGRMVDPRGQWWLSELAVGVQVRGGIRPKSPPWLAALNCSFRKRWRTNNRGR